MKTTTQNDLILYAYNECGLRDADRIQRGIDGDPLVQQEFSEIVQVLESMNVILVEPSQQSIDRILAFSRTCKT